LNPHVPECFKKLETICNVCGQYCLPKTRRKITENINERYRQRYNREMLADRIRSPNQICSSCRLSICQDGRALPFTSRMNWERQLNISVANHNPENCYCSKFPDTYGYNIPTTPRLSYPYHVTTIVAPEPLPSNLASTHPEQSNTDEPMDTT